MWQGHCRHRYTGLSRSLLAILLRQNHPCHVLNWPLDDHLTCNQERERESFLLHSLFLYVCIAICPANRQTGKHGHSSFVRVICLSLSVPLPFSLSCLSCVSSLFLHSVTHVSYVVSSSRISAVNRLENLAHYWICVWESLCESTVTMDSETGRHK